MSQILKKSNQNKESFSMNLFCTKRT